MVYVIVGVALALVVGLWLVLRKGDDAPSVKPNPPKPLPVDDPVEREKGKSADRKPRK